MGRKLIEKVRVKTFLISETYVRSSKGAYKLHKTIYGETKALPPLIRSVLAEQMLSNRVSLYL